MISPTLQQKIGEAMKAHDTVRLSVLRLLSSSFNYARIEKQHELSEEEEMAVIRKEVKQRRDSIESYTKAAREDLAGQEKAEMEILMEFLPPEMGDDELNQLVSESISQSGAKTLADMGKVIGLIKSKAPNVDGGRIAQKVKERLEV